MNKRKRIKTNKKRSDSKAFIANNDQSKLPSDIVLYLVANFFSTTKDFFALRSVSRRFRTILSPPCVDQPLFQLKFGRVKTKTFVFQRKKPQYESTSDRTYLRESSSANFLTANVVCNTGPFLTCTAYSSIDISYHDWRGYFSSLSNGCYEPTKPNVVNAELIKIMTQKDEKTERSLTIKVKYISWFKKKYVKSALCPGTQCAPYEIEDEILSFLNFVHRDHIKQGKKQKYRNGLRVEVREYNNGYRCRQTKYAPSGFETDHIEWAENLTQSKHNAITHAETWSTNTSLEIKSLMNNNDSYWKRLNRPQPTNHPPS